MQVQHIGYRIRGFYRVAALGYLWDMTPKDAQRRFEILRFFNKHGLAATRDAFGVSRRTLYPDPSSGTSTRVPKVLDSYSGFVQNPLHEPGPVSDRACQIFEILPTPLHAVLMGADRPIGRA